MFTILKNIDCCCLDHVGCKDIVVCGDKIVKMSKLGEHEVLYAYANVIECSGLYAFPDIIDQHIHLIGGGCEQAADTVREGILTNWYRY